MAVKLYHFTSRKLSERLIRDGFAGRTCWLSPDPATVCGESGRSALVEVTLNIADGDLQQYRQAVHEELIDPIADEVLPDPEGQTYSWYEFLPR